MSIAKHIETVKNFIITNIYFIVQLGLVVFTFVLLKVFEMLFAMNYNRDASQDGDKLNAEEKEDHVSADNEESDKESSKEEDEPLLKISKDEINSVRERLNSVTLINSLNEISEVKDAKKEFCDLGDKITLEGDKKEKENAIKQLIDNNR